MELMINATIGHEVLSFMDWCSGYNQIRMALEDEELTAFRTTKGIYCYKVMPFGIKNAGATYQHAMQKIFDDMLHKFVECYVDDLVVKTKKKENHLEDFRTVFNWLKKYDLKMNPLKCAFGVTFGKFLGFIVRHRGIEALTDFLADHPIPADWEISEEFPDEDVLFIEVLQPWMMFFDGISRKEGAGAETSAISVLAIKVNDWRMPIIDYLEHRKLPDDSLHRTKIRRRALLFIYYKETLFRRSFEGIFLLCLGDEETQQAMEEAHFGICGAHQSGPKLHFRVKMMDVVGPLTKSSAGHLYILSATDYFSKWAEAVLLKEVKKEIVIDFIKSHIIYRYGVPRYIITDNGKPFYNSLMDKFCERFGFKQRNSSMYNAPANGLAEAFNKTLGNLLKKVVAKSKGDCHERIGEALWANHTTHRTPTQATPYSLVYGVEAVLPLEQQIPSLKIAIQEGLTDDENAKLRFAELEVLDEKRFEAQQKLECYQARLSRAFNKKVKPRSFQVGELVLAVRRPIITTH
ncbi:uncharacterized protein K02A2.6-like [Camellia sinensis]|uniref:uncharacterized protein K02A2.6-like n=1 Tax=Camellia sinensis TaxID=4442 RepID=UPI0010365B7E|nr:uncharacterized protein K02A2.6-like [Camellia sinensis]